MACAKRQMSAAPQSTPQSVRDALTDRYIKTSQPGNIGRDEVINFLRTLSPDLVSSQRTLADIITQNKPEWRLADDDRAVVISVDDCNKMVFRLSDLEQEIDNCLHRIVPELASQLLHNPVLPISPPQFSILRILDLIVAATVGWSNDLGRSGTQLLAKVEDVVDTICSGDADYKLLVNDLQEYLDKEQKRVLKLEQRLTSSETGLLRSQRSKLQAAQMINKHTLDKSLTASIEEFLKGPWYDSIQLLLLNNGFDSDEWSRADKLTETVVWTYQPIGDENKQDDTQRLYRIVENLPNELRELLVALERTSEAANTQIEAIEAELVQIVSGQDLELIDSSPMPLDDEVFNQSTSVSRILLRKVAALEPGQWFTFEEDNVCIRIKLVLMLDDVKQLLFTNRNGMKALQKSFDEMAYYLSSGIVKPLNHEDVFTSAYTNYYNGILSGYQDRVERASAEQEQADQETAAKEAAKQKAITEAKALAAAKEEAERIRQQEEKEARLERARNEASKEENIERVKDLTVVVHALNIGALLKLPNNEGVLEDCKLAVRIATADKMIFVSPSGMKIGDYNTEQLVQLLVAGEGEIQEGGVEFEDTLAQVVTKLRNDRNKSYDDLTGSGTES
jgi:hypothetical protein